MGFPATGIKDLGWVWVWGLSRLPIPATGITAFMCNKSREFGARGEILSRDGRILDKSATPLQICPKNRDIFAN
jgi:hypothetical protein